MIRAPGCAGNRGVHDPPAPEYVEMQSPRRSQCGVGVVSEGHMQASTGGCSRPGPPTPSPTSDCPRPSAKLELLHLKSEEVGLPDL